jgi:hypothetical protein
MPPRKRKQPVGGPEFIDLTADNNVPAPQPKSRRVSGPSSSQASASQRASQPSSSFSHQPPSQRSLAVSYQEDEPEQIDLTQADDGPAFELYGSLGMQFQSSRSS